MHMLHQVEALPLPRVPVTALIVLLVAPLALAAVAPARGADRPPAPEQAAGRSWARTEVRRASFDPGTILDPRGVAAAPGGSFYVADAGHHRIAVVDSAGAVVAGFGERGDGPSGLEEPTDVAVDAPRDRVYVADYGNRRVAVFTLAGEPVTVWRQADPGSAFAPSAVAVRSASGDVYVVNRVTGGRVEEFDRQGTWVRGWGGPGSDPGQFNAPEDLTVDGNGNVLVADSSNGRVQVFSAAGAFRVSWSGLLGARDVAVDQAADRAYVLLATDAVQVLTADGAPVRTWTYADLAADIRPAVRLAVNDAGALAVTTGGGSPDGRQGLRQFGSDGALLAATLADPLDGSGFVHPEALAVTSEGDLLVEDGPTNAASQYSPAGHLVARLRDAAGSEIAAAPDGTVHVLDRWGRLRTLAADGALLDERTCDCFVGLGVAASASQVFVTEAMTQALGVLPAVGGWPDSHQHIAIADPPYSWPLDVALGPDGRLYAAGGDDGRVEVLDPVTRAATSWPAGGSGAERVSVAPDGTVFALRFDGTVAAFTSGGLELAEWVPEPSPGAGHIVARDLAAAAGGRLYLLDGLTGDIHVFEESAAPEPSPTPVTTPVSPCAVTGTKTASPATVQLGEEVTVTLGLEIACPEASQPEADVVLVMDRSNSMAGLKLADAKRAAGVFVDGLDLSRHRVALVSFSDVVTLEQPFTGDAAAIQEAIQNVQAQGTTDIAAAISRASRHIAEEGRPGALGVIVLLTDGEPTGSRQGYADTTRSAARARAAGVLVYAIGLGANVDEPLLVAVAGGEDRYYFAPSASDLGPIYQRLSQAVGSVVAKDLQVTDELGPDVELVGGSPSGRPVVASGRLVWTIGAVPQSGVPEMSLRVRPLRAGRLPTNAGAVAQYTADGVAYTYTFPVPEVDVVGPMTPTDTPTPTATATAFPTPTPPPTSSPSVAYLPFAESSPSCKPDQRRPADVILVVDASTSMSGDKLRGAVAAAQRFLELVSPGRDRVGLVSFNVTARSLPLTADTSLVRAALDALTVAEGTRIDLGLYEALSEFYYSGRPEAAQVAVLLSDGRPAGTTADSAKQQADLMRVYGVTLFTIGMGTDCDQDLLRAMASSSDRYYYAPTPEQLAQIYERIAVRLPCE